MMMNTYWVTIGYAGAPSPVQFRADIEHAIAHYCNTLVTTADMVGSWAGEPEPGRAYLVTIDAPNVPLLRNRLAAIAGQHRQDAIGFVGGPGTDTLVYATDR